MSEVSSQLLSPDDTKFKVMVTRVRPREKADLSVIARHKSLKKGRKYYRADISREAIKQYLQAHDIEQLEKEIAEMENNLN